MNLKTIATTAAIISIGLSSPAIAQNVESEIDRCDNCQLTIASAKNVNLKPANQASSQPGETLVSQAQIYIADNNWIFGLILGSYYYLDPFYWGYRDWYYSAGYYRPYDYYHGGYYRPYDYYHGGYYRPYDYYYGGYDRPYYRDRYYRSDRPYYSDTQIRQIYREVLGREPDYDGLRTWRRERIDGSSLRRIRSEIARSSEAETKINQIYRAVLGRDADPEGLRTWTNRLASGASLGYIRREIENSPEARDRRVRGYQPYRTYRSPAYTPPTNYSTPSRYTPPTRYSVPTNSPVPQRYTPPSRISSPTVYPRAVPQRSTPSYNREAIERRSREYRPFQPSGGFSPPAAYPRPSVPTRMPAPGPIRIRR